MIIHNDNLIVDNEIIMIMIVSIDNTTVVRNLLVPPGVYK